MTKRKRFSGNQCFNCGRQCVPATDNLGQPYMGCPVCRLVLPKGDPVVPSLREQLAAANERARRAEETLALKAGVLTEAEQTKLRDEILAHDYVFKGPA